MTVICSILVFSGYLVKADVEGKVTNYTNTGNYIVNFSKDARHMNLQGKYDSVVVPASNCVVIKK